MVEIPKRNGFNSTEAMTVKGNLRLDFYVTTGIVLVSIPLVLLLKVNFLTSTALFFILPSLYLLLRKPRPLKRILAASFLFGFVLMFEMDFLAKMNGAWVIPPLLFSKQLFGVVALDEIIWGFFWVFFIVVFYEHFFEHERVDRVSPKFIYGLTPALVVFAVMMSLFFVDPNLLRFPFAYLILGLLSFVPLLFHAVRKVAEAPRIISRYIKVTVFFAFVHLAHEITALKLGQWYFPGQYIGHVKILGQVLPFEELFFWIIISSSVLISYYEFFVDDGR